MKDQKLWIKLTFLQLILRQDQKKTKKKQEEELKEIDEIIAGRNKVPEAATEEELPELKIDQNCRRN